MTASETEPDHERPARQPVRPRRRLYSLIVSWLGTGIALMVAAALLSGMHIESFGGALVIAVIVAALNAVVPPTLAALRLPATLVLGFLLVLIADAVILLVAADLADHVLQVDSFGWALLASLVVAAVSVVLTVILGGEVDPLARFSPTAPQHLLRTDGFEHVGDIMIGNFYDPDLEQGCAFEELISFHGGLGGLQTRPFILHPSRLEVPAGPIVGAAAVHGILLGWRTAPQADPSAAAPEPRDRPAVARVAE